ncbi:MAG: nuclear transport factor 2 family protein [Planctomycetota bacterium]
MRSLLVALMFFAITSLVNGQELTNEQLEPWSALKKQVGLFWERNWDEHVKYIHPKYVDWGDTMAASMPLNEESRKYWEEVQDGTDKIVAFYLSPVAVVVSGDVAIINADLHTVAKPDGKSVEVLYRLHNTWKKENGRWLLLATRNKVVGSDD